MLFQKAFYRELLIGVMEHQTNATSTKDIICGSHSKVMKICTYSLLRPCLKHINNVGDFVALQHVLNL